MLTSLGKFLRTFRIQHNELLKDMADNLNVVPSYLSAIENGKRSASKKLIDSIISIYSLSENESKDLMDSFFLSLNEVSISIADASTEKKDLGIAFARKFENLNSEQIENIRNILGGD